MQQINFLVKNPDDTLRTWKAVPHPQISKTHILEQKHTFQKNPKFVPNDPGIVLDHLESSNIIPGWPKKAISGKQKNRYFY